MTNSIPTDELLPDVWFNRFRAWIRERLAIDFTEKQRRNLSNGLARAMREAGAPNYENYWRLLQDEATCPIEVDRLARLLTVTETYFFRDELRLENLQTNLLPYLIAQHQLDRTLTIWSAGCATGEEPYSLAIGLESLLKEDWQVTLYATDVNSAALAHAQRAVYRPSALREVSKSVCERFFTELPGGSYQLSDDIRRRVKFAPLNLIEAAYPSPFNGALRFDLIICRNVLIYFAEPQARIVLDHFYDALAASGILLSGQVEPVNRVLPELHPQWLGQSIVYHKRMPSAAVPSKPSTPAPPILPLPVLPVVLPKPSVTARPKTGTLSSSHTVPSHAAPVVGSSAAKSQTSQMREKQLRETQSHELQNRETQPALRVPSMPNNTPGYEQLYEKALVQANAGQWDSALIICRQLIARSPTDYRGHQLLGLIAETRADLIAAREALRRAIYLAPHAPLAHFYLANLYHRLHDAREMRTWAALHTLLLDRPDNEPIEGNPEITVGYLRSLSSARFVTKPLRQGEDKNNDPR